MLGHIYIYIYEDYFAISNSLAYLTDYIKNKKSITLNTDVANASLFQAIDSLSYQDTIINEITQLPRNAVLIIDVETKRLEYNYIDYGENSVEVDSKEFFNLLDSWYVKWTDVLRDLKSKTNNISVDLTGGFDSRVVFTLFLGSNINLDEIRIYSINDKLHTHGEDYEIASQIAQKYNFKLNQNRFYNRRTNFSLQDALNISFYIKLSFHKQMYYKVNKFALPQFNFGGTGGECIRPFWNMDEEGFINQNLSLPYQNADCDAIKKSIAKVIKQTSNFIRGNAKRFNREYDESYLTVDYYRNTRCRYHFGKAIVEELFTNNNRLTPLLDINLNKLKLSNDFCNDKNLLITLILTRYVDGLLDFKFDSNRSLNSETIAYAKALNQKYPYNEARTLDKVSLNVEPANLEDVENPNPLIPYREVDKEFVEKMFLSRKTRALFNILYDDEIYKAIEKDTRTRKFFPMQNTYPVIAIAKFFEDVMYNKNKNSKCLADHLLDLENYGEASFPQEGGKS